MPILSPDIYLENVAVSILHHRLLASITLKIQAGSWLGIVGPNGGGKSTLIKTIAGLLPYQGRVSLHWRQAKPGVIGYMPQRAEIDASLPVTVHDYLRIHCEKRPVWQSEVPNTDLDEKIDQLGVRPFLQQKVGSLSMGQHQRLVLCAALSNKPQLLLLDEPIAGVDEDGREVILQVLKQYHAIGGSILMVEHNWQIIREHCEQVAWIDRGLRKLDTPSRVFRELSSEISPFDIASKA